MKTIRRTQMLSFEGDTLLDFETKFNAAMERVGKMSGTHKEPVVDISTLRGYVIYEEVVKIPEGFKDKLDLANLRVTCGQCKHFQNTEYSWGKCEYCRGDLRMADEACEKFFKRWEQGDCWLIDGEEEQYDKTLNEP